MQPITTEAAVIEATRMEKLSLLPREEGLGSGVAAIL
jgi:hypothetical protein